MDVMPSFHIHSTYFMLNFNFAAIFDQNVNCDSLKSTHAHSDHLERDFSKFEDEADIFDSLIVNRFKLIENRIVCTSIVL